MREWLLQTDGSVAGLILRLTLAVVIFPHGAQKVFGWFGGHGFKNTLQFFTSSGITTGFALLVLGLAITLMLVGGGAWSVDAALAGTALARAPQPPPRSPS